MKFMVTGGSGFLGRRVLAHLAGLDHEVEAIARSEAAADIVTALGARAVAGDLDDPASIVAAFGVSDADVLINLASLGFGHAPTIVEAAGTASFDRALFVSTTAIFTNLPAASKHVRVVAENTIRTSELRWTIVRPTMIYGAPGDRNMERLLKTLRRIPILPAPGGGQRLQQPVHVDDLADGIVTLCSHPYAEGAVVDIPGPRPITFDEIVRLAGRAVGRRARTVGMPYWPALVALRGYERISRRPRLRAEQLERLVEDKAFDTESASRLLGSIGRSFDQGIVEEARALGLASTNGS